MIATGIKVLKADIVKEFYNVKIMKEKGNDFVYQPKSKTYLYTYEGSYYIVGALEESASYIIQAAGWIVFILGILFVQSLSWLLFIPIVMILLGMNLDWIMYGLGIMALRMYGYRGSYKKVSAENCVWVMMNGTR